MSSMHTHKGMIRRSHSLLRVCQTPACKVTYAVLLVWFFSGVSGEEIRIDNRYIAPFLEGICDAIKQVIL